MPMSPVDLEGRSDPMVVMTVLARDDADIIAANMDFHFAMGVDHIIVTNNRSAHGTREIVLDYVRRGVATLIDELDDDYDQGAWVTRMALRNGGPAVERNSTAGQDVFHVWRHQCQLQHEGRLEGWYRGLLHGDDPLVAEMVSRGDVVRDVRLKRFMESIVVPSSS